MQKNVKWYNNGVEERQIKPNEKIPDGFVRGRKPKPKKCDALSKLVSKKKLYNDYIIDNKSFKSLLDEYGFSHSDLRILINHYGIHKDGKMSSKNNKYVRPKDTIRDVAKKSSITQKQKWKEKSAEDKKEWSEKCRQAQLKVYSINKKERIDKYLNWWHSLTDEQREEINLKRSNSCKNTWKENYDVIQDKRKITEKENRKNRLCRSVAEQKLFDSLINIYEDAVYDIRVDERYPYFCDFYIPSEDLFIELNAHPSHGRLPIKYLDVEEYSKYPYKWVDVFSRRDVEKQHLAKKNSLNYIMIYPNATLQENLMINDKRHYKLIEKLYQTQK